MCWRLWPPRTLAERQHPGGRRGLPQPAGLDCHRDRAVQVGDEVPYHGALAQELVNRRHADLGDGSARARRSRPTCPLDPTGIVDLFTRTAPTGRTGRAELVHDPPRPTDRSASPSAPSGVGTHRKTNSASVAAEGGTDDERRPARMARPSAASSGRPYLEHVDVALREASDLVGVDVTDDDVVSEVGQARAGRQPDVAGADDADAADHTQLTGRSPSARAARSRPGSTPVPLPVGVGVAHVVLPVRPRRLGCTDVLAACLTEPPPLGIVIEEKSLPSTTSTPALVSRRGSSTELRVR